jgi:hypothetical protein
MDESTLITADIIELNSSQAEMDEREVIDDLVLQNETMDALIKGLSGDIEFFKKEPGIYGGAPNIVRFTMQLNIMRDKKARNLSAINRIVKSHTEQNSLTA